VDSQVTTTDWGPPSPLDRFLTRIGIRNEEKSVTALLFSNMFLSGITLGMIRVCAYTLFLSRFESKQLALIAILLAVTGTLMTLLIDWLTRYLSVRGYLFTILGFILFGLLAFRSLLSVGESPWLIFALPLWFELAYMLYSLEFTSLMARLLNVRQTKRLAALVRSGEFLAEMVAGLSIVVLLKYIEVADLLIVASLATLGVFLIVQRTVSAFEQKLTLTSEDLAPQEQKGNGFGTLIRQPYVRFICICETAYLFAYFFLDIAFYEYTSAQLTDQRELAAFLGQFFALAAFLTMIFMVFLFAPFLRRLGVLAGVVAFPIVVAAGSAVLSLMEFSNLPLTLIFIVMVLTNGSRFILQSSVWRPSIAILFQVLPDRQRALGTSLIEGIIDPLAGGIAGICLYLLTDYLGWQPHQFLLVLVVVMAVWIGCGFSIRRLYLSNLVLSLQRRKLGEMVLTDLDNASLNIIKNGLNSQYPAEVYYCLNLLEEVDHPDLSDLIGQVLSNDIVVVRIEALQRVRRLKLTDLADHVVARMEIEADTKVLGQAYKTYGALGQADTAERLEPNLSADDYDVQKGAMVGLLRHAPHNKPAQDHLMELVRSGEVEERRLAADLLGEIGLSVFSEYLAELLEDPDLLIVDQAITSAGIIQDPDLIDSIVAKIPVAALQPAIKYAMHSYGESAIETLDRAFCAPHLIRQEKLHIIDILRAIGGTKAIETLCRYIDIESAEIRHYVFLNLAHLHYQADPDDRYIYVNHLIEEVDVITWLLAAMGDLYGQADYALVHSALGSELDLRRDKMLLLISFIFPSIIMLDTRAHIDSKVAELRTFALEVLDNLLSNELKEIVLPLLDDLRVTERLHLLKVRFPQQRLSSLNRFEEMINSHYGRAFYWTRACMLHQLGKDQNHHHSSLLASSLQDGEPVVRETALWSMSELNEEKINDYLDIHINDPSATVRAVARDLKEKHAAPPNSI